VADELNGSNVPRLEEGCGGRECSAVEGTELLAVEPTSGGLCGAGICVLDRREKGFEVGRVQSFSLTTPRSATGSHDHHRITVSTDCSTLLHRHGGERNHARAAETDPDIQQKPCIRVKTLFVDFEED